MHILIITPNYHPDLGPSAPLYTMLCENLVQRGHSVAVITAVPHYPSGQVPAQFRGRFLQRTCENGVNVTRVRLPSVNRRSLIQRSLQFIVYQLGATLAAIRQNCEAVIVANPALQVWLPFFWSSILRRKPVIYSVHDVYPEVGIKLGIFKSKSQITLVRSLENFCLQKAQCVRILSESFRTSLRAMRVPESKMQLIYDWVDTSLVQPLPHDNAFSRRYGLHGKFIVMYAGNIGLSQGLDHCLTAAALLTNHPDVLFVFVGDGTGKVRMQDLAKEKQLHNVQFIPFQPREKLPEVLASADISLVIMKEGLSAASLPSKIFSVMASGRPILISVNEESEAWQLIKNAGAGKWVPAEDPTRLAEAILQLKQDASLRNQLGQAGRLWAEEYHSPQVAAEQFEHLLNEAVQRQ